MFQPDFRIAATGVVLDLDKSLTIVKKLKLTGVPFKIFKNTSFIKVGMGTVKLRITSVRQECNLGLPTSFLKQKFFVIVT